MIDRNGTEIPPASFLPTAERFGLMAEIDRFVVGRGIELARGGRAVAVNISGPSLTDGQLIDDVAEAIREGMAPGLLSFELTETAWVANLKAARRFAGYLKNLGIEVGPRRLRNRAQLAGISQAHSDPDPEDRRRVCARHGKQHLRPLSGADDYRAGSPPRPENGGGGR